MANRLSIFVDAGYLFKQGAGAIFGEKLSRREVHLNAGRFVSDLATWLCDMYPNEELLRTYWYDVAKNVSSTDQLNVAASLSSRCAWVASTPRASGRGLAHSWSRT